MNHLNCIKGDLVALHDENLKLIFINFINRIMLGWHTIDFFVLGSVHNISSKIAFFRQVFREKGK